MKKQLILSASILFLLAGIAGCKKDSSGSKSFRNEVLGRWQVSRIETSTYNAGGTIEETDTVDYTPSDYLEFKDSKEDEMEISLGGNRIPGNYVLLENGMFNMNLPSKLLYCTTDDITDNNFQFTGTIDGTSPKVTETYYLKR